MSRIGKQPIPIPKGVEVHKEGSNIRVKGPKGELNFDIPLEIEFRQEDDALWLEDKQGSKRSRALHGVSRTRVANMVAGVTVGFSKILEIIGVGYRAQVEGRKLVLNVRYDHPVEFVLPEGINAEVKDRPLTVTVSGIDKALVGQIAANIRAVQKPDPYKGKGIKYADERIRRKAGKSAG
jgi:large subunit ribosomal protein L6